MQINLERQWMPNPRCLDGGFVSLPRKIGEFMFANRLERHRGKWRVLVAGRAPFRGEVISHVVNTDFDFYPTREQLNACVGDGEEVVANYLQQYIINMTFGPPKDDEEDDDDD